MPAPAAILRDVAAQLLRQAFIDNPGPPRQMPYANQHDDRADGSIGIPSCF